MLAWQSQVDTNVNHFEAEQLLLHATMVPCLMPTLLMALHQVSRPNSSGVAMFERIPRLAL